MKITLYRTKQDQYGTHGEIQDENGRVLCYTIERADGRLIPVGIFNCEPHIKSNNGQDCWMLDNVPGHTGILIHSGNTEHDSEGCIIVGLLFNNEGVLESRLALEDLKKILPPHFTLEIINTCQ